MLLVGRTRRIGVGWQDLWRGVGLTTGRHGSVSLDVSGVFWGGRAQGRAGGSMSVSWAGPEM